MTQDDYNTFCASLPHTSHVVQWGDAHVWKVGEGKASKVFAVAGWHEGDFPFITFKCSPMSYDMLQDQPGLRPAPYLASRGMKWIQRTSTASMDDGTLRDYLRESHRLASLNLPKAEQKRLGLNQV
ncbi:MAG: MmcQ/YjbR family DNA-binding protein [Beijerinckiaceae bacterium]